MRFFTDKGFERYMAECKEKEYIYHEQMERFRRLEESIDRIERRIYELEHGSKVERANCDDERGYCTNPRV